MSRFSKVLFGSILGVGLFALAGSAFAYSEGSVARISPSNDLNISLGDPVVLRANIDSALFPVATWYELTGQSGVNISVSGGGGTATLSFTRAGSYGIILDVNIFGDHDIASIVVNVQGGKPTASISPNPVVPGQQFTISISSDSSSGKPVGLNYDDGKGSWTGWTNIGNTNSSGGYNWTQTAAAGLNPSRTYKYQVRVDGVESNVYSYNVSGGTGSPPPPTPTPPPPPSSNIVVGMQGLVFRADNQSVGISTVVEIAGPSNKTVVANPDWQGGGSLQPGNYRVTVDIPSPGYESAEHSICYNGAGTCHTSWSSGATANVTLNSGFADVWFRLTPNLEVNPPAPQGSEVCNFGVCSASEAGLYSCNNNSIRLCRRQDANNDGLAAYCYTPGVSCPSDAVCTGQSDKPQNMCQEPDGTGPVDPPPGVPPPPPGTPPPAIPPPPAPVDGYNGPFSVQQRVQTNDAVNVRTSPGGDANGGAPKDARGRIFAGPLFAKLINSVSSYWWWVVVFDSGITGWVAEDFLRPEGAPIVSEVVNAGPDQDKVFAKSAKLEVLLRGWTNPEGLPVKWSIESAPENGDVTFEFPTNPETKARFTRDGNYVLKLCLTYPGGCDKVSVDIRQGGQTACSESAMRDYIARTCTDPNYDPYNDSSVGHSGNRYGPFHPCNIQNLPAGGLKVCGGKYAWPNTGNQTTGSSRPNPDIDRDIDQKGLKLIIEAWNPNWLRAFSMNGIGQTDIPFSSHWLWTNAYQESPYTLLGIPQHQADFIPEEFLGLYRTPEDLLNGPGVFPSCLAPGGRPVDASDPNGRIYSYARGWRDFGPGKNPDGSTPGAEIRRQIVNGVLMDSDLCIPDWSGWRSGDPVPLYLGGPFEFSYQGCGNWGGDPSSNRDAVECGTVQPFNPPPPPPSPTPPSPTPPSPTPPPPSPAPTGGVGKVQGIFFDIDDPTGASISGTVCVSGGSGGGTCVRAPASGEAPSPSYQISNASTGIQTVSASAGQGYRVVGSNKCQRGTVPDASNTASCHFDVNHGLPYQLEAGNQTSIALRAGEFIDVWWGLQKITQPPVEPPVEPPPVEDEAIWYSTSSDKWTRCPDGWIMDGAHVGNQDNNGKWMEEFRCVRVPGSGGGAVNIGLPNRDQNTSIQCPGGKAANGVFLYSANDKVKYISQVSCVNAPLLDVFAAKQLEDDERTTAAAGYVTTGINTSVYDPRSGGGVNQLLSSRASGDTSNLAFISGGGGGGGGLPPCNPVSNPDACIQSNVLGGINSLLAQSFPGGGGLPFPGGGGLPFPGGGGGGGGGLPCDPLGLFPGCDEYCKHASDLDPFCDDDDDDEGPQDRVSVAMETYQLSSADSAASVASAGICNFTRDLEEGMSGEDVRCLQRYLNISGYRIASSGAGSPGNETTFYGSLTKAAVGNWQDAHNLNYGQWRGYFGPASRALYNSLVGIASTVRQSAPVANTLEGVQESLNQVREYLDSLR